MFGNDSELFSCIGDRSLHRGDRQLRGVTTGSHSGRRSLAGVKTEEAAAEAGISFPVAFRWFRHAGGVNPCLPPMVTGRFLSFTEREDIAIWHAQGAGVRDIARRLGRSPSTVSRELRRNASTRTYRLHYKASLAQWHAERRARRPKIAKLVRDERLRDYVQERLSGAVRTPAGRCRRSPWSAVEGPQQAPSRRSSLGGRMESRADREPAEGRFPP